MMRDKVILRIMIITGVLVSSLIALCVIVTVSYIAITAPEAAIPEVLNNWGGLIIGFYFGSFIGLFKDSILGEKEKSGVPGTKDEGHS